MYSRGTVLGAGLWTGGRKDRPKAERPGGGASPAGNAGATVGNNGGVSLATCVLWPLSCHGAEPRARFPRCLAFLSVSGTGTCCLSAAPSGSNPQGALSHTVTTGEGSAELCARLSASHTHAHTWGKLWVQPPSQERQGGSRPFPVSPGEPSSLILHMPNWRAEEPGGLEGGWVLRGRGWGTGREHHPAHRWEDLTLGGWTEKDHKTGMEDEAETEQPARNSN